MPITTFFYPPGVCTDLNIYGQSQPLLVLGYVTDGGGDPVADDTEVDVTAHIDKTWACEDIGFYVPPTGPPCPSPPVTVDCTDGTPTSGPPSTRDTRNGLVIAAQSVGPSTVLKEVHWEVDGSASGQVTFPTFSCSPTNPSACDEPDGTCEFDPTGDGCTNDRDWIDGVPVLSATPGDGEILWEVVLPDSYDVRVPIEWGISVSTGTPSSNPSNQMRTSLSYLQTGLTNGATYYGRAQAFLAVGSGVASDPKSISNIASATPSGTPAGLTVSLSGVRAHRT